jgi:hypothetical protein
MIATKQAWRSGASALSHPRWSSATAAADQIKRSRFGARSRAEKTIQFFKTFAGLSQLGSGRPCGSRGMPLKRLIEFSAE